MSWIFRGNWWYNTPAAQRTVTGPASRNTRFERDQALHRERSETGLPRRIVIITLMHRIDPGSAAGQPLAGTSTIPSRFFS